MHVIVNTCFMFKLFDEVSDIFLYLYSDITYVSFLVV